MNDASIKSCAAARGQRGQAGNQGESRTRWFAIPTSPDAECLKLQFLGTAGGVITAVGSVHMRAGAHLIPSTVCCSRSHTNPSIASTSPHAVYGGMHSTGARKGSLLHTTQGARLRSHNFSEESHRVSFATSGYPLGCWKDMGHHPPPHPRPEGCCPRTAR